MRFILIGLVWQNGPEPVPLNGMVALRIKVNANSVCKLEPWKIDRLVETTTIIKQESICSFFRNLFEVTSLLVL